MRIPGKYITLFLLIISSFAFSIYFYGKGDPPLLGDKLESEAVSKGENILIQPFPWLNAYTESAKECKDNWQLKLNSKFEQFIQKCTIDIESKIYLNNTIAEENADRENSTVLSIAIVVPISGNKDELRSNQQVRSNPEMKFNGGRIFQSIEILKGIEIVQREYINGIEVGNEKVFLEVLIVDDSYIDDIKEEKKAQKAANYLVGENDVVAAIGHFSSDSIQAAASIYDNRLVAFSPTSTAIRVPNKKLSFFQSSNKLKLNKYIYRTSPNDEFAVDTLIDVVKNDDSLKTAIVLYEEERIFSKLFKQHFEKQFLKEINDSEILNKEDSENSEECKFYDIHSDLDNQKDFCTNYIVASKPDVLLLVPSNDRALDLAGSILEGIKDLDPKPQLLGADTMFSDPFLSKNAEGMITAVPLKTIETSDNIQLSWRGAMTYDAAKAIVRAIEKSKCDPNSNSNIYECFREQMQKVLSDEKRFKADGILGNDTVFFQNGDRQVDNALEKQLKAPRQVKKIEDSDKYEFVLYDKNNLN